MLKCDGRVLLLLYATALVAAAVAGLRSPEVIELVATGEVQLVAKEDAVRADAPVVSIPHAGQSLRVYGCESAQE